jgi:hypothetical protein
MTKPTEFMKSYGVAEDEIWSVRPGIYAIKHAALERVAAEQKIEFDRPAVLEINTKDKVAVLCVFGKLGERTEWSIGEASPANCKNSYPAAMAEKRAKDRVTLKLLNAHGALYSDSEADDFQEQTPRQNPHVTRPSDIVEATEYDQNGMPVDNIPPPDIPIAPLPKKDSRDIFSACQTEIRNCTTIAELEEWAKLNANRVALFKSDWQEILRGIYAEHRDSIRNAAKMQQFRQKEVA